MVEGGRLEIVLAVLNCHVGSNPTLSARFYDIFTNRCNHLVKNKVGKANNADPTFLISSKIFELLAILFFQFFPDL